MKTIQDKNHVEWSKLSRIILESAQYTLHPGEVSSMKLAMLMKVERRASREMMEENIFTAKHIGNWKH
jgi:hypothetical protein